MEPAGPRSAPRLLMQDRVMRSQAHIIIPTFVMEMVALPPVFHGFVIIALVDILSGGILIFRNPIINSKGRSPPR